MSNLHVLTLRARRRATALATALVLLLTGFIATAGPANALDYYSAGSASKGPYTVRWALGPVDYYNLKFSDAWSWTSGNSTTSKVYNVRGSTTASSSLPTTQVQNALGPVDANRNPILASTRFGTAVAVYHHMESRSCLIKGLNFACTSWTAHRGHATLKAGGTWFATGDY